MRVFTLLAPFALLWITTNASPIPCPTDKSLAVDTTSSAGLIRKPGMIEKQDTVSYSTRPELVKRTGEDMLQRMTLAHEHDAAANANANAVFAHHAAMEAHRTASQAHVRAGNTHKASHHTDKMHDHARKLDEHSTEGETHREKAARARDYKQKLSSTDTAWSAQMAKFHAERSGADAETSEKAAVASAEGARHR